VGLATLGVGNVNIRGFATRFHAGQWLQRIREESGRGGFRQGAQAIAFAPKEGQRQALGRRLRQPIAPALPLRNSVC
jgi:hypothetical protein